MTRAAARQALYLAGLDLETAIRRLTVDPARADIRTVDAAYEALVAAWREYRDAGDDRTASLFGEGLEP
jgi:hypothetical protein